MIRTHRQSIIGLFLTSFFFCLMGCQKYANNPDLVDLFDQKELQQCGFGLIVFLSAHSCQTCMSGVQKLNEKTTGIPMIGVLDPRDRGDLAAMREAYTFRLEVMDDRFKPYAPLLSPSFVAVDRHGRILMMLPGLPDQDRYIQEILWQLVPKAIEL